MEKARNSAAWTEAGYDLFAEEGLEGLRVERLARILQLNKSGFYHYFGDLDIYCEELLRLHQQLITQYLIKVRAIKSIDPEYLQLLIEIKMPTFFQMQLGRIKNRPSFRKVSEWVDQQGDDAVQPIWCQYLGVEGNSDLAMRYLGIVRSMFYERINFKDYTFPILQSLLKEAKVVANQLSFQMRSEAEESLH